MAWWSRWSAKTGSDDPLCDAPSPCEGLAEGNCGATAPAGQTLALAGKAEKKEEAEKPHDEGNAPMQQAEAIAPNALGQLNQVGQYFCDDKKVWLATDEALGQILIERLMAGDLSEGVYYTRRNGKDRYWIDFEAFKQQNCNKQSGGRERWLRVVEREIVWDDPQAKIADQIDEQGVMVPRRDFNWQWQSEPNIVWENMPSPMNDKLLALVDDDWMEASGTHQFTHTWKNPRTDKVTQTIYSIDFDNLTQTNPDSGTIRQIRMVYDVSVHEGGPQNKLPAVPDFGNQPNDSKAIDSQPSGPDKAHSDRPPKDYYRSNKSGGWGDTQGWQGQPQAWTSNQKGGDAWSGHSKSSTQGSKQDDKWSPPATSWSDQAGSWEKPPWPHQ